MMPAFLTEPWLALVRTHGESLPAAPGASLVMQHVVTGAPQGKVHAVLEVSDGQVAAAELGKRADATCTVTWTYKDAGAIVRGDASVDEAFMRGDLKVEGDYTTLLFAMRPVLRSDAARHAIDAVRAGTEL
jgi:putative sterol carrier protein